MKQILLSVALLTATILSAKVQKQILPIDPVAMEVDYLMESYYPQEIYGGLKLDSVVTYHESTGKSYFVFDAKGQLTKMEALSTSNRFQVFFTYDNDGKCVQSVAQIPNMYTVQWEDVQKAEFKSDAKGRTTEAIFSVYSSGKWQPVVKYEATYDAHDNCTLYTIYEYQTDLGTWKTTDIDKQEYTYNDKGLKTQYVYSYWDQDNGWTMSYKDKYEYDAQGRETLRMNYNWDKSKSGWVEWEKTETGYSDPSDGVVIVLKRTQRWNGTSWSTYSLKSYTYTDGKQTKYVYSQMENSELVIKYTITTSYNSKGQVLLKETEYTSGSKSREEYMYDDFGNLIAQLNSSNGETTYSIRYYFSVPEPQSIDQISPKRSTLNAKRIANGQLLIEHNGHLFNASGARLE